MYGRLAVHLNRQNSKRRAKIIQNRKYGFDQYDGKRVKKM